MLSSQSTAAKSAVILILVSNGTVSMDSIIYSICEVILFIRILIFRVCILGDVADRAAEALR